MDEQVVLCDHQPPNHDPDHLTYLDLICLDLAHGLEIFAKQAVALGDWVKPGVASEQVACCKI